MIVLSIITFTIVFSLWLEIRELKDKITILNQSIVNLQ